MRLDGLKAVFDSQCLSPSTMAVMLAEVIVAKIAMPHLIMPSFGQEISCPGLAYTSRLDL